MSVVGTCQITDIVPHLYIKIVSSTSNGDTLLIRQLGGPSRRLYLAPQDVKLSRPQKKRKTYRRHLVVIERMKPWTKRIRTLKVEGITEATNCRMFAPG